MDKYLQNNRKLWDEITPIHEKSESYQLQQFRSGELPNKLGPVERAEVGDVNGKKLLHLQCHFGMDTLSWAKLGARVTGIDFSGKSIATARKLSREMSIPARFLEADIYKLPEVLKGRFDIVYTSYGVLCWLPDLRRWAEIIAHFLKRGGMFYIIEGHPFLNVFDNSQKATDFRVTETYFHDPEPTYWEPEGDYADKNAVVSHASYEWKHPLSEVINALIRAGLKIEQVNEFPYICWEWAPFTEKMADNFWHSSGDKVPMTFSIKATKTR